MQNPTLVNILMILNAIGTISVTIFIIYLIKNKKDELNSIMLQIILIGIVACVIYGFMHNVFVNPTYFNAFAKFDFSKKEVQAFLLSWSWRGVVYFTLFPLWMRTTIKKARNWDDKSKIIRVVMIQAALVSTAWLTDFEKLWLTGGSVDLHHILHWVGGIIGTAMFSMMMYLFLEKRITKYVGVKKNNYRIKTKFMLLVGGIVILLMIACFSIVLGCLDIDSYGTLVVKLVVYMVLFLIPLFVIIVRTTNLFSYNLNQAVDFLQSAANQDFTKVVDIDSKDEFGKLGHALILLKNSFKEVMRTAKESATDVDNSALEIGNELENLTNNIDKVFEDLNQTAQQQAVSTTDAGEDVDKMVAQLSEISDNIQNQFSISEENSGAIEEMNATLENITKRTKIASKISNNLLETAQQGSSLINNTLDSIQEISESSIRISEINDVINNISEETNLLAMNAAIEAAHAGEKGKGFAIVADEMRELASNAATNAERITDLIEEIMGKIAHTMSLMEKSKQGFSHINKWADNTNSINQEISAAMVQQSSTLKDILNTTTSLVEITRNIRDTSNALQQSSSHIKETFMVLKVIAQNELESTSESSSFILSTVDKMKSAIHTNKSIADKLKHLIMLFKLEASE